MNDVLSRAAACDFETTNVDPKEAHPIEFGLHSNSLLVSKLIKPPIPIPPDTSAIHHIIDEDVANEEPWEVVKETLKEVISKMGEMPILVAHNAEYERTVMGEFIPVIWVCTYKAALRVWPEAPNHKNETLRYWLGLGDDRGRNCGQHPHSAYHDARVTFSLFVELLKHASFEDMVAWTEQPAKLPRMPMGKHRGMDWKDVPAGYLNWCLAQADMREDVKFCCRTELERRRK